MIRLSLKPWFCMAVFFSIVVGGAINAAHLTGLYQQRRSLEADVGRLTLERDSWQLSYEQARAPQPRRCVKGTFYTVGDTGIFQVGEMEMCGENMSTSPVMGPSFEAIVKTQDQTIETLLKERDGLKEVCHAGN